MVWGGGRDRERDENANRRNSKKVRADSMVKAENERKGGARFALVRSGCCLRRGGRRRRGVGCAILSQPPHRPQSLAVTAAPRPSKRAGARAGGAARGALGPRAAPRRRALRRGPLAGWPAAPAPCPGTAGRRSAGRMRAGGPDLRAGSAFWAGRIWNATDNSSRLAAALAQADSGPARGSASCGMGYTHRQARSPGWLARAAVYLLLWSWDIRGALLDFGRARMGRIRRGI